MSTILTDEFGNGYTLSVNSVDGSMIVTPEVGLPPSTADNAIRTTSLSLITSALRLIGVLASGETPEMEEANDSLMVLDQMLDGWNADGLAIYTTSAADFALIPSKQAYTLGPGGDFDSSRPARIDSMSAILLNNPANPVEVPIHLYSVDDWQTKIPVKNVSGSFPQICYDTRDFPLRVLNMWPIPNIANKVRIYSWQALGIPSTLQTSLSFPPGYAEAFRFNLAVRLASEFGATASLIVQQTAVETMARLKTMNAPDLKLKSDLVAGNGGYNFRADMFGLPY